MADKLQLVQGCLSFDSSPHMSVMDALDLDVIKGRSTVLLGPSGCGKSTLLNVLAGFQYLDRGQVRLDSQPVDGPSGQRAVVFQHDALLPWLTVWENVAIGLKIKGISRAERYQIAIEYLALIGLEACANQQIDQLSGGQRQRVGLARALAIQPDFILLDEPFGALDALTREKMQHLLLKVWQQTRVGLLLITHSVDEALLLATDLYLLQGPPVRLATALQPDYAHRFLQGASIRELRADRQFALQRQTILDQLLEGQ